MVWSVITTGDINETQAINKGLQSVDGRQQPQTERRCRVAVAP
jgi:hypothetical protein